MIGDPRLQKGGNLAEVRPSTPKTFHPILAPASSRKDSVIEMKTCLVHNSLVIDGRGRGCLRKGHWTLAPETPFPYPMRISTGPSGEPRAGKIHRP